MAPLPDFGRVGFLLWPLAHKVSLRLCPAFSRRKFGMTAQTGTERCTWKSVADLMQSRSSRAAIARGALCL